MDSNKNSVLIAVREAPMRCILLDGHKPTGKSILSYSDQCPNTLIVDGNIYNFDFAFNSSVKQSEIYDALIHPLVLKVLSGYDCTALAYGQTGTGKSYTMGMTAEPLTEDQLGVVPRCLSYILKYLSELKQQKENNTQSTLVTASFIEIYNEKAYDLLACNAKQPIASRGQWRVSAGIRKPLRNQMDLQQLLQLGATNRHVRPTNMNGNSSRSHAIVTIHVRQGHTQARLNIVDLAGSEGVRRTGNEGMARTEGVYINMGLLGINKVLMAMSAGHTVIPYRDSILTTVLQESLSSDAYLTLLACVSPHPSDLSETNSTLRFAKNAKRVKLNPRLSQQLQKIQHQVCATQKKSIKATRDSIRGVLPSSTAIKRPVVVRSNGTVNKTLCIPGERSVGTKKPQCRDFVIGLTPTAKDKECAPNLLNLPLKPNSNSNSEFGKKSTTTSMSPGLDITNCGLSLTEKKTPIIAPSMSDYMELKRKYTALKQRVLEHEKKQDEIARDAYHESLDLNQSLLSYSQFNSELCSIAEESDQTSAVRCKLFSSISSRGSVPVDISGICALSSICTSTSEEKQIELSRRGSKRLTIEVLNDQKQPKLRRSIRLASRAESRASTVPTLSSVSLFKNKNGNITNKLCGLSVSEPQSLCKHRAILLDLLNAGGVKELQALPCIGPKTALMLVMQRSRMGHFKNWRQVEELPIWKGNSWIRFANANCILPCGKN
ncbi:hypothetical protein ACLKA6_016248 [Drosophila palustris]